MGKSRRKRAARATVRSTPAPRASLAVRTRAFILGVLPVIAIFLGTRQLLAEAFRIPSGSMEPTLFVGDWLFVNKLRFGPHIPFTNHSLPGYATPKRGDVTVFVVGAEREGLHRGDVLLELLDERLERKLLTQGPYFFADLAGTTEADEQTAIDAGEIQPARIDYVGVRR